MQDGHLDQYPRHARVRGVALPTPRSDLRAPAPRARARSRPPGRARPAALRHVPEHPGQPGDHLWLLAAAHRAGLPLFLGAYPITPAGDILHELSKLKSFGVHSFSYDPDHHDLMVRTRQAKVDGVDVPLLKVEDPSGPPGLGADVLVLGWGSTYGAIGAACRRVRRRGAAVAQAHLRHLNPLPANTASVLSAYRTVLVPR